MKESLSPGRCPSSQVPGRGPGPVACVRGTRALSPQVRLESAEREAAWAL